MVGACGTGAEDALSGQKRNRKTSLPTCQTGKFMALGFMICWMDHEPIVRSLESAAIWTLRPYANNEMEKKRKRADIERRRPLPGLRGKLPARAPQSILVTYNKTKTRGKHVRPEDNQGSWVWHSDFKSLYTFEQKRLRPYQGPLSLMEDESLSLLVLWVCQRSSKVDWPTLYLKARSRRPLLKCAEMLSLVVSPSRRAVGSAKVSKELKRQGLPGVRPFTLEVNVSETVAFARAAWRRRVQSTDVCFDEKAWLRRQVRFRAAKEQKFDKAVNAQKIARSFSFHEVAARHPLVLESQIQGQGMKLVDKRWDVPTRQHTKERFHGTMKAIRTITSKFGVVWGGLANEEKMKLMTLCEEKSCEGTKIGQSVLQVCARYGHRQKKNGCAGRQDETRALDNASGNV